jgi:dephospho-CoA kinase
VKVVGITGSMGSGKTTVLKMFKTLGVSTYIADVEAKRLMKNSIILKTKIIEEFGSESYIDGELNRSYLAKLIFKDATKLKIINSLVHPAVRFDFEKFIRNAKGKYVLYESALLLQSDTASLCDYIILVSAPFDIRVSRILKRDATREDEIKSRLKHQKIPNESLRKATFFIENSTLKNTQDQVLQIHNYILSKN